jgi:hypothetical protein
MNALLLALSLSSSFTKVGAIVAFAALLGIAILSLLVFSQAREIKRLREWAGRAPERALEAEQRVTAGVAARTQRVGAPAVTGRVQPRQTPLVSAPVSTAVHATAAAAVPLGAGTAQQLSDASDGSANPDTGEQPAAPEQPSTPDSVAPEVSAVVEGQPVDAAPEPLDSPVKAGEDEPPVLAADENGAAFGQRDSTSKVGEHGEPAEREVLASSPATPAAQAAAGAPPRSPLPPSPSAPAPPVGVPTSALVPEGAGQRPVSRPPAPVAATRRTPSRTATGAAVTAPRAPSPSGRARAGSPGSSGDMPPRAGIASAGGGGPKYFKPERSNRRTATLIVAGVVVVVLLMVLAISVLKGKGSSNTPTTGAQGTTTETSSKSSHAKKSHVASTSPAETSVTVLNGTSTAGLAHHLASDLQQTGYSLAAASAAVPPGTHATTVIEYARGHRADAQSVAKTLNVTQVQAMDSTTAALAGSADIVVLAGADQASLLGGGGAQSKGEPAVGSEGTQAGATGAGATEGAAGAGQ